MTKATHILLLLIASFLTTKAQDTLVLDKDTVLLFKPDNYNAKNAYPLVYLLHGYSENYRQWSNILPLQKISNENNWIIVCPDGFVGWYLNSPYDSTSQLEDFFFNQLVPQVHKTVHVDTKNIFISGLSMGGYGALRYFLLHPDYFNTAGSTSGGTAIDYDLLKSASIQFFNNDRVTKDLTRLLGNKHHQWQQYNIVNLLQPREFIFDCGTSDILYPSFLKLQQACKEQHIPATAISQPGNHNADYWQHSIQAHFNYFKAHIKKGPL